MSPKFFIEVDRGSTEFQEQLAEADPSARTSLEERLDGNIDLVRMAVELTPAVAFVIGRYLRYLESNVSTFTIRDSDGKVISMKGDVADRFFKYLKEKS